jgi:hypothetical protein
VARSDWLLISDADIVWNPGAVEQLQGAILRSLAKPIAAVSGDGIASVASVLESQPSLGPKARSRYGYEIIRESGRVRIQVQQEWSDSDTLRPGVGLIYAQRQTLLALGGYRESFRGWGWEDQDLLMRAALLGIHPVSAGEVMHLSHGDEWRNRFHQELPQMSRDRNIVHCLQELERGQLYGDLPSELRTEAAGWTEVIQAQVPLPIQIRYPPGLA